MCKEIVELVDSLFIKYIKVLVVIFLARLYRCYS